MITSRPKLDTLRQIDLRTSIKCKNSIFSPWGEFFLGLGSVGLSAKRERGNLLIQLLVQFVAHMTQPIPYQIIVADAADAVSVNFFGRCKFLQI